VDILQKLGLGSGGVTAQQNIDFSSKPSSARHFKALAAPSEELAKDTFFDIVIFPNARSEGIHQQIIKLWTSRQFPKLPYLLFTKLHIMILIQSHFHLLIIFSVSHLLVLSTHSIVSVSGIFVSFLVGFCVPNYINIGVIDVFEGSHVGVYSHPTCAVNAQNFDSVTWLNVVN